MHLHDQPAPQTDDIYCELILPGEMAVEVLAETDRLLAFRHTKPAAPFHAVIVPKEHIRSLLDLEDDALVAHVFRVVRDLVLIYGLEESAFRLVTNGGDYQESKHLHFHLLSPGRID